MTSRIFRTLEISILGLELESASQLKRSNGSTCVGIRTWLYVRRNTIKNIYHLRTVTVYIHCDGYNHSWGDVYGGIVENMLILRVRWLTRQRATYQLIPCTTSGWCPHGHFWLFMVVRRGGIFNDKRDKVKICDFECVIIVSFTLHQ